MSVERTTHYSDPELLAYVDGELSWWRRIRVRRHLEVCWKCRSRAHAQQEEIVRLTESLETWEYPGVFWHLDQQLELGRRLRRFEMLNQLHRPQSILRRRSTLIGGALFAVIVMACVLIEAPRSQSPQTHPVLPTETLAGARNFERKLYQHPVEQTLALEVEHVIPVRGTNEPGTNMVRCSQRTLPLALDRRGRKSERSALAPWPRTGIPLQAFGFALRSAALGSSSGFRSHHRFSQSGGVRRSGDRVHALDGKPLLDCCVVRA